MKTLRTLLHSTGRVMLLFSLLFIDVPDLYAQDDDSSKLKKEIKIKGEKKVVITDEDGNVREYKLQPGEELPDDVAKEMGDIEINIRKDLEGETLALDDRMIEEMEIEMQADNAGPSPPKTIRKEIIIHEGPDSPGEHVIERKIIRSGPSDEIHKEIIIKEPLKKHRKRKTIEKVIIIKECDGHHH